MNIEFYVLPKIPISPNPKITRDFLDKTLKKAIWKQKKIYPGKEVNVLGISMGNVLAFRFAQHFKVNKFISVVPGSRLAECIWESIATRKIVQNSGRSFEEYKKNLADYNPIENVKKITPTFSEIYLGKGDLMIPYKRGKELAELMEKKLKTKIKTRRFSGHVETVINFSKEFSKIARA
jgi:esterase/lipase